MTQNKLTAYLAMFLNTLFIAGATLAVKLAVVHVPPNTIVFVSQGAALTVQLIIALARKIPLRDIPRRTLGYMCVNALLGVVFSNVLANHGIALTTVTAASVIYASTPVFTLFFEALHLRRPVGPRLVCALAFSVGGVLIASLAPGGEQQARNMVLGNMLMIACSLCWAASIVMNKRLSGELPVLTITTVQSGAGFIMLIPFMLAERPQFSAMPPQAFGYVLYIGIMSNVVAAFLGIFALKRMSATVSSLFINLMPVFSILMSRFMLHEQITVQQTIGMALIFGSLLISIERVGARRAADR
jgi:drug/metabolite transporter (DMT)-like permease